MILHTIISEQDIFDNGSNVTNSAYKMVNGVKVEYSTNNGENYIVRLHSTNPYNYLNKDFEPYTILK